MIRDVILDQLPFAVFSKDHNLKYIFANQGFASLVGVLEPSDILPCRDGDFPNSPSEEAAIQQFEYENRLALEGRQVKIIDANYYGHTQLHIFQTIKQPVYGDGGSIESMLSVTAPLEDSSVQAIARILNTEKFFISEISRNHLKDYISKKNTLVFIPKRQAQSLYLLLKGHSAKCVASQLGLSRRTVEYYLGLMRDKLFCQNTKDLIAKAAASDLSLFHRVEDIRGCYIAK